jgi:hypothetical protein
MFFNKLNEGYAPLCRGAVTIVTEGYNKPRWYHEFIVVVMPAHEPVSRVSLLKSNLHTLSNNSPGFRVKPGMTEAKPYNTTCSGK